MDVFCRKSRFIPVITDFKQFAYPMICTHYVLIVRYSITVGLEFRR